MDVEHVLLVVVSQRLLRVLEVIAEIGITSYLVRDMVTRRCEEITDVDLYHVVMVEEQNRAG